MDKRTTDDPVVICRRRHGNGLLGFEAVFPWPRGTWLFSVDVHRGFSVAVPLELVGRVRAALQFHHKTWGGKRCARSRRVHFCLSLCWAGVRVLVPREDALVRRFDELIRKRMTDAIADVFPEEGFAELVMSFCPVPGEL